MPCWCKLHYRIIQFGKECRPYRQPLCFSWCEISKIPWKRQKWQYLNVTDPPKIMESEQGGLTGRFLTPWLWIMLQNTMQESRKIRCLCACDWTPPKRHVLDKIRTELLLGKRFPPSRWLNITRCGVHHIGQRSIFKYFQPIFGWCVIMLTWHLQNTNPVHLQHDEDMWIQN